MNAGAGREHERRPKRRPGRQKTRVPGCIESQPGTRYAVGLNRRREKASRKLSGHLNLNATDVSGSQLNLRLLGNQLVDAPNRQEHRQTNVARSNLEQLAPKQSLIVLTHQHNQSHSESQHRAKREQRSLIGQLRQVIALQHIGLAETQVAPGNTQPHNEA